MESTPPESSKPKKAHSKFRFTCYATKVLPNVVVSYSGPTNFKVPTNSRSKGNAKAPQGARAPQTPEQKAIADLFKKIQQKDVYKTFANPVKEEFAPNYFTVIKEPMDLSTIKQKMIHDETYNLSQFKDDVYLMIRNCMTYNPEQTVYYQEASKLYSFFKKSFKQEKQKLMGIAQQDIKSLARGTSTAGQIQHRNIQSLSIPVKVKSFVKYDTPAYVEPHRPDMNDQTKRSYVFMQLQNPMPILASIGDSTRFEVFLDVIRHNEKLRNNLKKLKEEFSVEIMNDEIRKMAQLPPIFEIDDNAVDKALQYTLNDEDTTHVVQAPIDEGSLQSLVRQIPGLNLSCFLPTNLETDPNAASLRLLFFYQNMLRYWCSPDMDSAKKKILKDLESMIGRQLMDIQPTTLCQPQDSVVLMHIHESTNKTPTN